MRGNTRFILTVFFCCLAFLMVSAATALSVEGSGSGDTQTSADSRDDEIRLLEAKEAITEEVIKRKEEEIQKTQEEAVGVSEEKQKAEEEAVLKQKEAELAKEKAEALSKQAEIEQDAKVRQEAEKLEQEAQLLKEEADVSLKKLEMVEVQEKLAQKSIISNQKKIEELKFLLQDIRKEKTLKKSIVEKILVSVGSLLIGFVLFLLLKFGTKRLEGAFEKQDVIRQDAFSLRMKTTAKLLNWLGGFIIIGIVLFMVLETFGFSLGPLLAGAGIVGLAFGFGGQYLIRDLINGLFILIEGQYRVDDVVKINDLGGLVEDINLRITTLRDLAGRVIIIPNGEIKAVINYTRGYAQALFDIGVAYKENVDKVMDVIKELGKEMREDTYFSKLIIGDLEMLGVDDFADSAVMIKFRIKTRPIKQWEVSREFRRRLKNRFDELGIEIPFPHRTIYWGTDKDNQWLKESVEKMAKGS